MSRQDVELVRRAMEAWNREDIDELIELSDPEVKFVSIFAGMEGRTYRGYDGLRRYVADMKDASAEFHRDIEEIETRAATRWSSSFACWPPPGRAASPWMSA